MLFREGTLFWGVVFFMLCAEMGKKYSKSTGGHQPKTKGHTKMKNAKKYRLGNYMKHPMDFETSL